MILLMTCAMLSGQILDPAIIVTDAVQVQSSPQTVSNFNDDQYLVVWEDYRNGASDVFGQLFEADGTLIGENFPICNMPGNQYLPHVDFDPYKNQYLVVFKDQRNYVDLQPEAYDIYGCFLTSDAKKVPVTHSEADTCFRISFMTSAYANWPSVAFNHIDKRYLVVWSEYMDRNLPWDARGDIKGQLLSDEGELLVRADLAKSNMPIDNFFIANFPDNAEDVTDITWNWMVNEWLVVYSFVSMSTDPLMSMSETRVFAQRINSKGVLLRQDGTEGFGPMDCSGVTGNGAPCSWPCVQANYEFLGEEVGVAKPAMLPMPMCESLVGWRTYNMEMWADIWGQRIAYYTDEEAVEFGWKEGPAVPGLFFAAYYSTDAVADDDSLMGFPISMAMNDQNHFDLGYSALDNEFACGWGDRRNYEGWQGNAQDLYLQLMPIWEGDSLKLTDLTHLTEIPFWENIEVSVDTSIFEGSSLYTGMAHSAQQNQFLLAYVYASPPDSFETRDVHARRIQGFNEFWVEPELVTGLTEDFEDGVVAPYWVPEDDGGFVLNEADGMLQLDVSKERGFAAVRFVPYPDYVIDMSANPYISVKVKASNDVMLQVGPTNLDQTGNPNAVPTSLYSGPGKGHENVIGGNDWVTLAFDFTDVFADNGTAGDQVHTIFLNFNPGNQGTDPSGNTNWNGTIWFDDLAIGDQADLSTLDVAGESGLPKEFDLLQNYPNPFNPTTLIRVALPNSDHVTCTIFDIQGREVRTLVNTQMQAGYHDLIWDSRNQSGQKVTSGVYVYQVKTSKNLTSKKMILMR